MGNSGGKSPYLLDKAYQKIGENSVIRTREIKFIHYIFLESGLLEVWGEHNGQTWTATDDDWDWENKTLTLNPGVTSVYMKISNDIAKNFKVANWYFDEVGSGNLIHEDLNTGLYETVFVNLGNKDEVKIFIQAIDPHYVTGTSFTIKVPVPKQIDVWGLDYCEGDYGSVITSESEIGTTYKLHIAAGGAINPEKEGNGLPLEWDYLIADYDYLLYGTRQGVRRQIGNVVSIVEKKLPLKPEIKGCSLVEEGVDLIYEASSLYASSYNWIISDESITDYTEMDENLHIRVDSICDFGLKVYATNECGNSPQSDELYVRVINLEKIYGQIDSLTIVNQELRFDKEYLIQQRDSLFIQIHELNNRLIDIAELLNVEVDEIESEIIVIKLLAEQADQLNQRLNNIANLLGVDPDNIETEITDLQALAESLSGRIAGIASLLDVDEEEIEYMIEILLEVYVIEFDSYDVTTHIVETEIGTFTFNAYPNPNPGELFISCTEIMADLQVYSISGQVITQKAINDMETSLIMYRDLFNPGTYIIKIVLQSGGSLTQKIIFSPK